MKKENQTYKSAKHVKWSYLLVFAAYLVLSGCSGENKKAEPEDEEGTETEDVRFLELRDDQFKAAGIELGKIEKRTLSENLTVSGVLDVPPQNRISISAPYGGFLKNTELLEGSSVKKGEVIATLEHPDYIQMQQDYLSSFNQLEYLEKEYERQKELQAGNATSGKILQKAESDYKSTFALIKGLEAKLALIGINKEAVKQGKISSVISIISPVNGKVSKVNVNIGKYVNPQDVIFEIIDPEHLHVELTIFEKDISMIKVGQKIRFTLANQPNVERKATVHLIGQLFDESRSVHIHGHLDQEDPSLLPGMFVNAVIETISNEVLSVPSEAIIMSDGKNYIFVKNKTCATHPECSAHESCLSDENCKSHPDCEAHEKCKPEEICKKHPQCEAHEKFPNEDVSAKQKVKETDFHTFTKIEVIKGITDGKFVQIIPSEPIPENSDIVIKGVFILLSQAKAGKMDACGQ